MTDINEEIIEHFEEVSEENESDNFFIDVLTGMKEKASKKKLLIQKVLRQLIESYGFDRRDLEVNYNPKIRGHARKRIDIAIFRSEEEHNNENLQRIVLCRDQKKREKLRSIAEAEGDLRELRELMEILPDVSFGMWTNDQEDFLFQVERSRFEVRSKPLAVWPAPGEASSDLDRTGGVIQVAADIEGLEDALSRCSLYLSSNQNLGLGDKAGFQQLALLLFAKMYDETRSTNERLFWIKGDEPFTSEGQEAIQNRISAALEQAMLWQPGILEQGWISILKPYQTSRIVVELARYSLSETQPSFRTRAFRSIARSIMDGREGRYPTPLNVAELMVQMLAPQPGERIMDCASGTGTFLAMAATHIYKQYLAALGSTPEEADATKILQAQKQTADWAANSALGCEIDPFLVVASRINLFFTTGNPGRIYRLDARSFPEGDLEGVVGARSAMPLGSMDMVLLNPWFSAQDTVSDSSILERYDLGHKWEPDGEGGYRNTGDLQTGGVPPEILFLERALQWVNPGKGRIGILLPDGLLGNPGDEYVRWWILRNCEVLASVDLPVEPFKVTVKEYGMTPALPSLLVLRRRSHEEMLRAKHPDYNVFMAIVDRAGVDARGKLLFQRAPDGEELIFEEEVIERVRVGSQVEIRRINRRDRRIHDELPVVVDKYKEFQATGEVKL